MNPPPIVNPMAGSQDGWPDSPVALNREIRDLRQSLALLWTLLVLFFGLGSLGALTQVPHFHKIFDDMIPGGAFGKLPMLTQLVIRWAQNLVSYLVVGIVMLGSLILTWTASTARAIMVGGGLAALLLGLHLGLVVMACFSPLISIISSLGGP